MGNKVSDLLRLPSLKNSYIIGGHNGALNIVKKIDILESPYPIVEKFLMPYEFVFTSFWNCRDDKENRINLMRALIRNKCSGIGIMPGPNLNDCIDDEIIELANEFDVPVLYIPSNVLWSDIISEFSMIASPLSNIDIDSYFTDILLAFSEFQSSEDINKFCIQLNEFLSLPIVMIADDIYYSGVEKNYISILLSKVNSIAIKNKSNFNIPISLYIGDNNYCMMYCTDNVVFATFTNSSNMINSSLEVFHKIAPVVIKELDNLVRRKGIETYEQTKLDDDYNYYICFVKKDNIERYHNFIRSNYIVVEENDRYNYLIFMIPENMQNINNKNDIFEIYSEIINKIKPRIFIFSKESCSRREVYKKIEVLRISVGSLFFIEGIFIIDELPLLYMIFNSPYSYMELVFKVNSFDINIDVDETFLDTLRLYLILRNINDVSNLLGIHPNSVKYRISKCFRTYHFDTFNALSELPIIRLLLVLEIIKIKDFI